MMKNVLLYAKIVSVRTSDLLGIDYKNNRNRCSS